MNHRMTKPTKWPVHWQKTQINLVICPAWSESSLCTQWVAKDPRFLHADSEDSEKIGWVPRLNGVFTRRTYHFVGFVKRRLIYTYRLVLSCCTSCWTGSQGKLLRSAILLEYHYCLNFTPEHAKKPYQEMFWDLPYEPAHEIMLLIT